MAILYHEVPNPSLTIRDFFIATCPIRIKDEGAARAVHRLVYSDLKPGAPLRVLGET
jgi:hypothetical protein